MILLLLAGLLLSIPVHAATWRIQTPACAGAMNCYSPLSVANLQTVFDSAACGDTVIIEHYGLNNASVSITNAFLTYRKQCPLGSEIVYTTDLDESWLPAAGYRILPSYRNLLPRIGLDAAIGNNAGLSIANKPNQPSGLRFDGIWFDLGPNYTVSSVVPFSYWAYLGEVSTTGADTPATALTSNILFNRTLWYGQYAVNQGASGTMPSSSLIAMIRLNTKDFTFTNSYVGGIQGDTSNDFGGGLDSAVIRCAESCGAAGLPVRIHNNVFCCGWTEHFLTGGNLKGMYLGNPMADYIDFQHNVILNSPRFMLGSRTFLGNNFHPFIKNFFEIKEGTHSTFRWNTGVNSWNNDFSQWFGAKVSHYMDSTPNNYCGGNPTATLSTGAHGANSRVQVTGGCTQFLSRGGAVIGICKIASCSETLFFNDGEWEYHRVESVVDPVNFIYNTDAAYTTAFSTTNTQFMTVTDPWTNVDQILIENNLFRNAATAVEVDGGDTADYCVQVNRCMSNVVIRNNLQLIDSPDANFGAAGIQPSLAKLAYGGSGITIDHNGTVIQPTAHPSARTLNSVFYMDFASRRSYSGLRITSNLGAPTLFGIVNASGGATLGDSLATFGGAGLLFSRNSFVGTAGASLGPGAFARCSAGQTCSSNVFDNYDGVNLDYRFLDPIRNNFQFKPGEIAIVGATNASPIVLTTSTAHGFQRGQPIRVQDVRGNTAANGQWVICFRTTGDFDATHIPLCNSDLGAIAGNGNYTSGGVVYTALWQGGADGQDMGPDYSSVPLLHVSITPMTRAALFTIQVPSKMSEQSCQIEVTPDSGLLDDSADYTVVNALRPDYFKRADHDSVNIRATVDATRAWRFFQVGDASSVTGDDGKSHNLELSPSTTYYWRILCGGAMERGSFATTASSSGATQFQVRYSVGRGGTRARLRYGQQAGSLTTGPATPCAGTCSLPLPVQSGRQIVYYIDELDSGGVVLFTTPVRVEAVL